MSRPLSEARSKALLVPHGIPFAPEHRASDADAAVLHALTIGFPVVIKLSGDGIAHKTERGLVRLGLDDADAAHAAASSLLAAARPDDGEVELLVAPQLAATRELIAGLHRDAQFGMTIMLGVGGILAEALGDAVVRLVPLERRDARQMIDDLRTQALLGAFRGEPAVDREALADLLMALGAVAAAHPDVVSVDLNPLMIVDGRPVAVDALVEVAP